MRTMIQRQGSSGQHICLRLWADPAQAGTYSGSQFCHAKRLYDIIVRTQIQTLYLVKLRSLGCQHDHRDLAGSSVCMKLCKNLKPILVRQHHIQQNQIRLLYAYFMPERAGAWKALDGHAHLAQRVYHQFADAIVIFHIKNHVRNTPLCFPVSAYSTHSAMFCAWSPIRS